VNLQPKPPKYTCYSDQCGTSFRYIFNQYGIIQHN